MTEAGALAYEIELPGPRPVRPDAVLRVSELGVRFASTVAVESVSFSLDRGEILALVGESGSGKTVTAQAVLGLLPPSAETTGSVQLTEDPVGRPAQDQPNLLASDHRGDPWAGVRGRLAAMVFQEPQTALNPVKTVGWQLCEALRAHRRIGRRPARERAIELLTLVGIPEPVRRVDAYPHQLSGGQKQRVVIALALANDPVLLIADEPTTALDVSVQAEILELLGKLREQLGMAVLLITHNMGVVADLADRVLVMRAGRMVERGEVVSLFSAPFTDYTRDLLAAVPRLRLVESEPDSARPRAEAPPVLAFREASVDYPGRFGRPAYRALHELTIEVAAGQVLCVVGESGSGKSTLGRAALGLLPASDGRIEVAGEDLGTASRSELRRLRRRIGVVPQDPAGTLDPLLSVGDSVAEPLQVHRMASGRALRRRVAELLDSVSLPSRYADRRPHELSGGQRQRVALARALALGPDLLIADEPTSALDVSIQAAVLAEFARLREELGFACVFISHDLAVVDSVSDRVLVLADGRAVESGPTARVLSRPKHPYTQALLDAVPVPDPIEQRVRRP
ncbi:MAG TPA: ABC transporter ATP-binding protein [Microlunatus sp.]|nr:ABC transporter ATP-binding protein [Microlunatus sp.]